MQRDTATYMFLFAGAVCVVCAVMVSGSAVSLKERQQVNQQLDRQRSVLFVAGIADPNENIERQEILSRFESRIERIVIELETGETVENPPFDPVAYNQDKAAEDPEMGMPAPPNEANVQRMPKYALAYRVLDEAGNTEMVVLPVKGYGLWSTLYGYLAVDDDGNTIRGLTFYRHGETPGLGGEVDNPRWKALWPGRKIYADAGDVELEVIKGQAGPASSDPYRVDGLSGATITSRGVSHMMELWLGPNGFKPFLEKLRQREG